MNKFYNKDLMLKCNKRTIFRGVLIHHELRYFMGARSSYFLDLLFFIVGGVLMFFVNEVEPSEVTK